MRIAVVYDLIYPFSKGGVEKRVADISHGLALSGHEVHVFGTKQWSGNNRIDRGGVHIHGVGSTRGLHSKTGRRSIWQALSFAVRLMPKLWGSRFDVVEIQSMSPMSGLATVAICRLFGTPVVVTWHEVWQGYWRDYLGSAGWLGIWIEGWMAKFADSHVAVSSLTAARVEELGARDVEVIGNGIDTSRISAVSPALRGFDIIYVGRLDQHKRLDLLIDAAILLEGKGFTPTILIVGDGPCRSSLEQRAHALSSVFFLDPVDSEQEVWSLMKASTFFVTPSTREGFGLAALEALGCGLPVVTACHRDNAIQELVTPGVNGLVVAPNPVAFARALETLLADEDLRSRMSRAALVAARSHSLEKAVCKSETVFLAMSEHEITNVIQ